MDGTSPGDQARSIKFYRENLRKHISSPGQAHIRYQTFFEVSCVREEPAPNSQTIQQMTAVSWIQAGDDTQNPQVVASFSTQVRDICDPAECMCARGTASDIAGSGRSGPERQLGIISMPEPDLRLSDCCSVLEKVLLLHQHAENRMGEIPGCDGS
jgi:hypothetical protein